MNNDRYILMNKDKPIASLYVSNSSVFISEIIGNIPSYIGNINNWISNRAVIIGRDNLVRMAKIAGISTEPEFLTISKAISINDTFWVNDTLNPTTWDKINPYRNRISRIMAEMAINGIEIYRNQNLRSPSPQYRIDGSIDKCVKRESDGKIYLYKTAGEKWSDLAGCRPYCEYYSSEYEKKLELSNFVDYKIKISKTEEGYYKPYVYSEIFTDENRGLLQIGDSKYNRLTIKELYDIIPSKMQLQLKEMALLDSIILNPDRHSGNYGFFVNNDTYKILGWTPIYDNDCSLGALTSIQNKNREDAFIEVKTNTYPKLGLGDYDQQARWALTRELRDKLMRLGDVSFEPLPGFSKERLDFIEYIVNRRRWEILKMV